MLVNLRSSGVDMGDRAARETFGRGGQRDLETRAEQLEACTLRRSQGTREELGCGHVV